jgi:uracil-DNA glycosylase
LCEVRAEAVLSFGFCCLSSFFEVRKMVDLKNDWTDILRDEFEKEYYLNLREFLREEYKTHRVFPEMQDIFSALRLTSYESVKVVILGQDPYHGEGQAHGLAFSVKDGVAIPPSLRNMYKEIYDEVLK